MKYIRRFCLGSSQYFSLQISVLLEKKAMVNHKPLYSIAALRTELFGEIVLSLFLKL